MERPGGTNLASGIVQQRRPCLVVDEYVWLDWLKGKRNVETSLKSPIAGHEARGVASTHVRPPTSPRSIKLQSTPQRGNGQIQGLP